MVIIPPNVCFHRLLSGELLLECCRVGLVFTLWPSVAPPVAGAPPYEVRTQAPAITLSHGEPHCQSPRWHNKRRRGGAVITCPGG